VKVVYVKHLNLSLLLLNPHCSILSQLLETFKIPDEMAAAFAVLNQYQNCLFILWEKSYL